MRQGKEEGTTGKMMTNPEYSNITSKFNNKNPRLRIDIDTLEVVEKKQKSKGASLMLQEEEEEEPTEK